MSRANLFAYTSFDPYYPEYISVNREDNGKVSITVRGKVKENGSCGETVSIELDESQVSELRSGLTPS